MKIIIIGFMGAGKTTVSKELANKLNIKRIEMDDLITIKSGRNSNWEIFDKDGEVGFREFEIAVAKDLRGETDVIISTGGGIILNQINFLYLKEGSIVIFLKNSFETSTKRLDENHRPPLFRDEQKAKVLFDLRLPLYEYYADIVIETDNKPVDEIVNKILEKIKT